MLSYLEVHLSEQLKRFYHSFFSVVIYLLLEILAETLFLELIFFLYMCVCILCLILVRIITCNLWLKEFLFFNQKIFATFKTLIFILKEK